MISVYELGVTLARSAIELPAKKQIAGETI
jgi:hypothetical protein